MKMKFMDVADMIKSGEEHQREMYKAFEYDKTLNVLTLKIAYPYHIQLSRIKSKSDLLGWVVHLCEKEWMTAEFVYEFVTRVCRKKKWTAYTNS